MAKKTSKIELMLEDVPAPLRNKFIVVTALFVVWMFFFDSNSIISQYRLQATLQELQSKETYYEAEISQAEKDKKELFTDDKTREKFAREHYYMKKADEDIFVIQK